MGRIISLDNVTAGYDGRPQIVDVNLDIDDRDFVGIIGPNGGGKTTLLRVILKLLPTMRGEVKYWKAGSETNRLAIGYLPQFSNIDRQFPITVEETVMQGLASRKGLFAKYNADHRRRAKETLMRLELADLADSPIKALSGGQLQRTLIARAIVGNPDILVFDEPNTYIDQKSEVMVQRLIGELNSQCAIVMVSHDRSYIRQVANKVVEVDEKVTIRQAFC